MAQLSDRERLVGKIILDAAFRNSFFKAPKVTAASIGVHLTDAEVARVRQVNQPTVETLSASLTSTSTRDAAAWSVG